MRGTLEFWKLKKKYLEFWNFQFAGTWILLNELDYLGKMTWIYGIFILLKWNLGIYTPPHSYYMYTQSSILNIQFRSNVQKISHIKHAVWPECCHLILFSMTNVVTVAQMWLNDVKFEIYIWASLILVKLKYIFFKKKLSMEIVCNLHIVWKKDDSVRILSLQ